VRAALGLLVAAALGFVALTWLALESGGVAIVETRAPDGATRATHVWFVERDGALWLEAGSPGNGWFTDVQREPRLRVRIGNEIREARAEIVPEASHDVRAALRAKYGWRDAWVGLLVDSSRSVSVRLHQPE
jgi:hypothetical protein